VRPRPFKWDYTRFGRAAGPPGEPDRTLDITVAKENGAIHGFNRWTLNGEAFSDATMKPSYTVHRGERLRVKFRNASDDVHPLHLHRHSFELTRVGGKATSGVMKDVVMLGGFQELEFDFVADNPGRTLFHCHQQLHMDFGFRALFDYA
jgi:FtsP/CotA-like multicopper oxidase with cupredoxin domain